MDDGQGDTSILLAALHHLTAELGALGGMAHLSLAGNRRPGMRLVASSGLPGVFTRAWATISYSGSATPSRVMREDCGVIWSPTVDMPEQLLGKPPASVGPCVLPAGSGIAAVALPGPEGPLGTLSLITPPSGEPSPRDQGFMKDVARWAGGRLRLAAPRPEGLSRALVTDAGPPEPGLTGAEVAGGTWEWDLDSGNFTVDPAFTTLLGIHWPGIDLVEQWGDLIHPDDQPYVVHGAEKAILGHEPYDAEYRIASANGSYVWIRSQGHVELDTKGQPVRLTGTMQDTTEAHAALEPVGRALRHMTDGFLSVGSDWRVEFVNIAAAHLLGSTSRLSGRLLWDLPAIHGVPRLEEQCRQAVLTGSPTGFDAPWTDSDRWYHLRLVPVPGGLTIYCTDITERRLREAERADAARAAADRAGLVGTLTRSLAEALTVRDVVTAVADGLLPHFGADGLLIAMVDNDRMRLVGSKGHSQAFLDAFQGLPFAGVNPAADALLQRSVSFIESADDYRVRYPESAGFPALEGKMAWAFLPLTASGRVGVCVVSYAHPRTFIQEERALLDELSGLIAQALERASLYDAATRRSRELQHALLPRELSSTVAVTAAARYLPAGHGAEVGGDWYDVIPLSAERVALVVGDVMGHGMAEAATMGRLRTAVRTLSDLELPPDEILGRLNDIVADLGDDSFATCLYGVFDPVRRDYTYASAGHPSPAIVAPDGTVTFPLIAANPPLGVAAPPFETMSADVPDGSLVVLYTDGLVETPTRDLDAGMMQLAQTLNTALRDGHGGEPNAVCDSVMSALTDTTQGPHGDDAVLLVARTRHLAPEAVADWSLLKDPQAAGQARAHVREQLGTWGLDDLTMATELIVSELVGNVVRYAKGPIGLRLLRGGSLICEVSDGSLTTPHIRHSSPMDEGGRGLQLVAAMAHRWGTRYALNGKCIWTEQPLPT
ncbi:SpoIIE family protein phosphatase [Streptomyces sp. NPDC059193]|uniref:SpoIIE family protein phosphatase n=1 Tax=Streptomyces sp. NPDC059193 TaxID=3346763 RepID=UPI0036873803